MTWYQINSVSSLNLYFSTKSHKKSAIQKVGESKCRSLVNGLFESLWAGCSRRDEAFPLSYLLFNWLASLLSIQTTTKKVYWNIDEPLLTIYSFGYFESKKIRCTVDTELKWNPIKINILNWSVTSSCKKTSKLFQSSQALCLPDWLRDEVYLVL